MNNKGQITVFLSLILSALLLLGLFAVRICKFYTAKARACMAVDSAISDIKSEYNSYIFEHYHILLFDKTDYGRGEAAVEEFFGDSVKDNLDYGQNLAYVAITDFDLLTDNNCEALKSQIEDYAAYAALDYTGDAIMSKTGGKDAVMDEKILEKMNVDINANNETAENNSPSDGSELTNQGNDPDGDNNKTIKKKEDDPRRFTKNIGKVGILFFVAPEDLKISSDIVDLSECPSWKLSAGADFNNLNDSFNSYSRLKKDLKKNTAWNNSIIEAGCGLAYAREVFNSAVNQDKNEDTVFKFELEYLACGKSSDYLNLKNAVNRICVIRFPINFTYLLSDTARMTRVKEIAYSLSFATAVPEPILKYLIAGCWSYVEALSDVRILLDGKKCEFKKSNSNWKTDINHLSSSLKEKQNGEGKGMSYEDYLLILMALDMDASYRRMLDVMQLNARRIYPDFKMENAAVGLTVDVSIESSDSIFDFNISGGY